MEILLNCISEYKLAERIYPRHSTKRSPNRNVPITFMKEVSDEHSWPIALSKMKRMIAVMSLVLCMSMSLGVSASAASYVPDDITYQNLNGQQLAVKVFTLLPDQDPSDLIEADFEHDGYLYSYSDMVKEEQMFNEENLHKDRHCNHCQEEPGRYPGSPAANHRV